MPYPKPLSEKSLEKMYKESGLSVAARDFLHSFFAACANLYGAISLRYAWQIYRQLKNAPKLRRKNLLEFSSIVRREEQPYYVFEVEELFAVEIHNELDRHIVSKELVHVGYGKFHLFYTLMEELDSRPYCVPDGFLSYADPMPSKYETDLLDYLAGLKSVTDACVPKHGPSIPNEHKGMKLGEFSFLNSYERFEAEWLKRPSAKAAFLEDCSGTEAEKLLRFFKRGENLGRRAIGETVQWFIDELEEVGVEMTQGKIKRIMSLITDYHNNSHLWCLSGWKPSELAALYRGDEPMAISFGSGMLQAFADGSLDREALVREIKKMGLEVID